MRQKEGEDSHTICDGHMSEARAGTFGRSTCGKTHKKGEAMGENVVCGEFCKNR